MANQRSPFSLIDPVHLPTWALIIGYPIFWAELLSHDAPHGITSPAAWILFVVAVLLAFRPKPLPVWEKPSLFEKFFWYAGTGLAVVILGLVVMESLKPIHLTQEFDCLQYHYTLPRQHLILGSFAHIPWAADDLFLLPVDFALSPFWFVTVLPNKIPQLIFIFGLLAMTYRLVRCLDHQGRPWTAPLAVLIVLSTHGFGIQMGTGMLDLGLVYLFLAALDSLRLGNWGLAGIEASFFFWSKPLMPLEALAAIAILKALFLVFQRNKWQIVDSLELKNWQKAFGVFLIASIFIAGAFVAKSIYYAGTPLFPLMPGIMGDAHIKYNPQSWESLCQASRWWMQSSPQEYGHGHGLTALIKHFWLLGVPEKGVNNAFDYPLGLTYLLMVGPFLFLMINNFFRRKFSVLGMLAVALWGLWWLTVQQSRFLFVPLLIMFAITVAHWTKLYRALMICLLLSLGLQVLSIWDAYKYDLTRWGTNDIRSQDKQLVALKQGPFDWSTHDVAYAQCPVMVRQEKLPHTIHI